MESEVLVGLANAGYCNGDQLKGYGDRGKRYLVYRSDARACRSWPLGGTLSGTVGILSAVRALVTCGCHGSSSLAEGNGQR